MSPPVFISYARKTSREHAEALWRALGEKESFLDSSNLEAGDRIPESLVEGLLGSRVVVVFADELYFRRWYCLWELQAALEPYLLARSEDERREALQPLVLALPADGQRPSELERMPPALRSTNWPQANELQKLVELVKRQLEAESSTLGERITRSGGAREHTRKRLLEESALPPTVSLARFKPIYPLQRPPSLESAFKGRANELWRIDFALSTMRAEGSTGAALSGALEGGAGFGKTRLALEYLHRLGKKHFPGGIFWVDADVSEERLEEQFHGILKALWPKVPDLVEFNRDNRNVTSELAAALDEAAGRAPILYVVDNVPEPAEGKAPQPLQTWCPALGKVALLVTSRAKLTLDEPGVHSLPVDTLEPEAAVALLTHELPGASPEDSDWQSIAKWVGYLPLALELLNRAMKAGGVTKSELLSRLEQSAAQELDQQMEALKPHVPPGSLRGVTEAFRISYDRLPEPAKRTAHLIAQLAPEPIPRRVLEALGAEAASPAVRTTLVARHYVTQVRSANSDGVEFFGVMHRLLADWLRGQSATPQQELTELCKTFTKLLSPDFCRSPRNWPLASAYLPHAQSILNTLSIYRNKDELQAEEEIKLMDAIGTFLKEKFKAIIDTLNLKHFMTSRYRPSGKVGEQLSGKALPRLEVRVPEDVDGQGGSEHGWGM